MIQSEHFHDCPIKSLSAVCGKKHLKTILCEIKHSFISLDHSHLLQKTLPNLENTFKYPVKTSVLLCVDDILLHHVASSFLNGSCHKNKKLTGLSVGCMHVNSTFILNKKIQHLQQQHLRSSIITTLTCPTGNNQNMFFIICVRHTCWKKPKVR